MRLTTISSLVVLLLLLNLSVRGEGPTKKKPKETGELAEIRAQIDSYVEAYNAGDSERLANHWSEQAVYVRPDSGEKVTGRKAIAKVFKELLSGDDRGRLKVEVDSIRLVTPDVAVEDGSAWVYAADGSTERSTYTAVHAKTKDGWRLDSVRETTTPDGASSASQEKLKELEWMLGDWIDESDDMTVEYSAHWAKNESFIVRLFKVSVPGAAEFEGTQIIGWDPSAKAIRSWVFDSDGGVSEGTWSKKGKSWVIKSTGFVADGRKATSVGTFESLDDNSFLWRVTNRQAGDEKLPDVPEVKIVRKSAE